LVSHQVGREAGRGGAFNHETCLGAGVVCPTQIDALIGWGAASLCR
jgi:hypothetical protein